MLDQSIQPIQKVIIFPMDIMMLQSTVDGAFGTWHHGGTWFVSCLFFCYLLTPVLVTFIRKLCNKQRVLLISILYVAAAYMPIASHLAGYSTLYSSVIYRCVQFFIGMLLAGIYMENKEKFTSMCTVYIVVALWVTLFGGITLLDSMGGSFQDYDFFAIPLFALLMLTSCYLKENVFGWLARSRIFRYMNSICYEFFMAQSICFKITNKLAAICDWVDNTFCKTITAGMICVGTAVLMHELITKPGQKIMRGVSNK